MQRLTERAAASRRLRTRREGGFALLEAVLVLGIATISILTIAIGLLTSVTANGRANRQQRLDLAMTTFVESVKRQGWVDKQCPTMSSTDPGSLPSSTDPNLVTKSDSFPADWYLYKASSDSAVQPWLTPTSGRRVKFVVEQFDYWTSDTDFGSTGDGYLAPCDEDPYRWPAARMRVKACWSSPDGSCDSSESPLVSAVVILGPREG